jgi:F0F1-type ATP synthase membrane subunit b/b'
MRTQKPSTTAKTDAEIQALQQEMQTWFEEIRQNHPFAKMTKSQIIAQLQKTRDQVYGETDGEIS